MAVATASMIHRGYKASSVAQTKTMLDLIYQAEDTNTMHTDTMIAGADETEESAVASADYVPFPPMPITETETETETEQADDSDEAEIAAYQAQLTAETETETETETEQALTVQARLASGAYVALYTTNPLGDLPATMQCDFPATMYNGKLVRKIACPQENVSVQRKSSRIGTEGETFLCVPEHLWLELQDDVVAPSTPVVAPSTPVVAPVAPVVAPVAPVVAPVAPVDETPIELTAEQLAIQAAQDKAVAAQQELDTLQRQLADLQEKARLAQEAAAAAAALVPVEITPDLRVKLDAFQAIAALDEQGIAKAFLNGLVWLKSAGAVRKDSGTAGKVPKAPSSSGTVTIHRNGSNGATAVVGTDKVISDELRTFIRAAKTKLVEVGKALGKPWNEVKADNDIARQLGYDAILYGKKVWNLRNGQHASVHADIV